ncbi:hypothetical protein CDD83_4976 [Cordyceps sp. RAO-2017]|nr:hypothetical protein CDD83_4976 [Cordyceps sp. RAO-2017]
MRVGRGVAAKLVANRPSSPSGLLALTPIKETPEGGIRLYASKVCEKIDVKRDMELEQGQGLKRGRTNGRKMAIWFKQRDIPVIQSRRNMAKPYEGPWSPRCDDSEHWPLTVAWSRSPQSGRTISWIDESDGRTPSASCSSGPAHVTLAGPWLCARVEGQDRPSRRAVASTLDIWCSLRGESRHRWNKQLCPPLSQAAKANRVTRAGAQDRMNLVRATLYVMDRREEQIINLLTPSPALSSLAGGPAGTTRPGKLLPA